MKLRIVLCTLFVVTVGSLLHFAWEWSGRNTLIAVFAATNESTWEHLKLAFWPALFLAPIQWWLYAAPPGWMPATVIRILLPPMLIVVLFYGYTSILGTHHLVLDIGLFIIAIYSGEYLGHAIMYRSFPAGMKVVAACTVVLAIIAFSTLTFHAPDWFLFVDPNTGLHGIPENSGMISRYHMIPELP